MSEKVIICTEILQLFALNCILPPCSVLGGMTTFLFASVCVSGIKVISIDGFGRRNRFILTISLGLGLGVTLVRSRSASSRELTLDPLIELPRILFRSSVNI